MMEQSREVFGDIPSLLKTIFYMSSAAATVIFIIGLWLKVSVWSKGRNDELDYTTIQPPLKLIKTSMLSIFSKDCLFSRKVMERSKTRALMLICVYWGFIILFMGTIIVAVDYDLGLDFLKGRVYLWYSLTLDIAGGLFTLGLLFFISRRYIFSKGKVVSGWDDAVVLVLMLLIALSGFCVEGIRLARIDPPAMDWSPVGSLFSAIFKSAISDGGMLLALYRFFWALHVFVALFFIAFLPFSKQFHMFAAQITTLEASMRRSKLMRLVHE